MDSTLVQSITKRSDTAADGTRYIAGYLPSVLWATIATAGYGLVVVLLWIHYARNGKKYMVTICIGATGSTVGYAIRLFSHWHPDSIPIYSIMTLFILVWPCLYIALDYMILSRLAVHIDAAEALPIRASRLAKLFVTADIVTFIAQLGAGGMLGLGASNPNLADIGMKAMLGALAVQAAFFLGFTVILLMWGRRVRSRYPEKWHKAGRTGRSSFNPYSRTPIRNWLPLYYVVLITCTLYIVRSAYRVAEYVGGHGNPIATNETLFYLFDAIPLLIAIALFVFIWPVRFMDEERETDFAKEFVPLNDNVYYTEQLQYPNSRSQGYGRY